MKAGLFLAAMIIGIVSAVYGFAKGPDNSVASPVTYSAGDPVPAKRIAVMSLNVSGDYSEQVREWLPALIEDRLLREGWTLVVRGNRMDHIQQERNLPGVKPETRLPDQELLGATTFLELNARIQVKDLQGAVGWKIFTIGDYSRAIVDLNGQIVDPATGVLKSSISVGGSAGGLKTLAAVAVGSDWRIGAGGVNVQGIKETLVGKAADVAAGRLLERLKALYGCAPQNEIPVIGYQPSPTRLTAAKSDPVILIDLPDGEKASVGEKYEVFRGELVIAELELVKIDGKRAEAKILKQIRQIEPADKARKVITVLGTQ